MRYSRRRGKVLAMLVVVICAAPLRGDEQVPAKRSGSDGAQKPSGKGRVPFTISKETTCIVGPLDKDGYPDYVAALNEHYGKGVTPQNNAAVPYWHAMGPARLPCDDDQRAEYFKALGMDPLPEKGNYLILDFQFADRLAGGMRKSGRAGNEFDPTVDRFCDEIRRAAQRPWSKGEFPRVAAWLTVNEEAVGLLVEASNRPRRFNPLPNGKWITWFHTEQISPFRYSYRYFMVSDWCRAAKLLAVRAMLRLGAGRIEDAWADLLACHRLARLLAEAPSLTEYCGALHLEEMTWRAEQGLLASGQLSATQIAKMRADLERLPAIPSATEKIDIGNRFEYLHAVCWMSRNLLPSLAATPEQKTSLRSLPMKPGDLADWDVLFRKGNATVDQVVACVRKSTLAQREAMDREMRLNSEKGQAEMRAGLARMREVVNRAAKDFNPQDIPKVTPSEAAAQRKALSGALADFLCDAVVTRACRARDFEDQGRMRFELTKLAFALAAYRKDRGAFPARLTDLLPKYSTGIPTDIFTGDELHYSLQDGACLIYSVGPNREDDGGKHSEGSVVRGGQHSFWDDIAVRLPAAK